MGRSRNSRDLFLHKAWPAVLSKKVSERPAPIVMVDLGQFLPGRASCGHLVWEGDNRDGGWL